MNVSPTSGALPGLVGLTSGTGGAPQSPREVAKMFESLVITQMMAPMFENLGKEADAFGGGGSEQGIYQSMLTEQYGAALSQRGGIGIADAVERYLISLQATGDNQTGTKS